jgi:dTMP kinase
VERVLAANAPAVEGLEPDLTLYLRLHAEIALQRRAGASALDRIEMEQAAFHRRVYEAYEELARVNPARIRPIDASLSVEEIAAAAAAELDAALAKP